MGGASVIPPNLTIVPLPIPGDPDTLDNLVRCTGAVAESLTAAVQDVERSRKVTAQYWDSTAQQRADEAMGISVRELEQYIHRLTSAGVALQVFSTTLRNQQIAQQRATAEITTLAIEAAAYPNVSLASQLQNLQNIAAQTEATVSYARRALIAELTHLTVHALTAHPHKGFDAIDALIADFDGHHPASRSDRAQKLLQKAALGGAVTAPLVPGLTHAELNEPIDSNPLAQWVEVTGSLFGRGPSPNDVQQGQIGDCYLLASAAALALNDPGVLTKDIVDNGDGTYDVTLYGPDGQPVTVVVDDWFSFYSNGAGPIDASPLPADGGGKWVAVLEKAYAEVYGQDAYTNIGQGGYPQTALYALTGQPYSYQVDPSNMAQILTTSTQQHLPTVMWTSTVTDPSTLSLAQQLNIVTDHAYYVESFDPTTGLIQLGNPWGPAPAFTPPPITVQQAQQLGMSITC